MPHIDEPPAYILYGTMLDGREEIARPSSNLAVPSCWRCRELPSRGRRVGSGYQVGRLNSDKLVTDIASAWVGAAPGPPSLSMSSEQASRSTELLARDRHQYLLTMDFQTPASVRRVDGRGGDEIFSGDLEKACRQVTRSAAAHTHQLGVALPSTGGSHDSARASRSVSQTRQLPGASIHQTME